MLTSKYVTQPSRFPFANRGLFWFSVTGLVNGFGIMSLNSALDYGTVTEVAPVVACSPLFTLLLSVFVFRRETITWGITFAVGAVVAGLALIVVR
jgi:drug/metabolite transporter (DMT)-like permease